MSVYLIALVKIENDDWLPDYGAKVHEIVHRHGGKYLSRSVNLTSLEGEPVNADAVAIIEFPSAEKATAFVDDPAYAPHKKARLAGCVRQFCLIDDSDVAGAIPYLPKG